MPAEPGCCWATVLSRGMRLRGGKPAQAGITNGTITSAQTNPEILVTRIDSHRWVCYDAHMENIESLMDMENER
jgi:hypothetical protein